MKKILIPVERNYGGYLVTFEPGNPLTRCTIYTVRKDIDPKVPHRIIASGIGVRKHGDAYDLETGCRMALQSALRKLAIKHTRQWIWKAYLDVFPPSERKQPAKKAEPVKPIIQGCIIVPGRPSAFNEMDLLRAFGAK